MGPNRVDFVGEVVGFPQVLLRLNLLSTRLLPEFAQLGSQSPRFRTELLDAFVENAIESGRESVELSWIFRRQQLFQQFLNGVIHNVEGPESENILITVAHPTVKPP